MSYFASPSFALKNFEGPLELLLYLTQKDEMDICEIAIKELTVQLIQALEKNLDVDTNAEILALTSTLLLIKSQKLLPHEEMLAEGVEGEERMELLQQLLEYCRFSETAQTLSVREEQQKTFFPRPAPLSLKQLGTGLEEIDLDELKTLLADVLARADQKPDETIQGDTWNVSSKMEWLYHSLDSFGKISFFDVFSKEKCRGELIVFFLALLEMMKLQKLKIVRENEKLYITSYDTRT